MATYPGTASAPLERRTSSAPPRAGGGILRLFYTKSDMGLTIGRLLLGVVMFPHGAQKLFGWFGGQGYQATMGGFEHMGIPPFFAFLAIVAESLGSIGLILGLLSRAAAFGIACNMVVAAVMIHAQNGFFMNWMGKQGGEGVEYHLLALGLAAVVIVGGAGALSFDRLITLKSRRS